MTDEAYGREFCRLNGISGPVKACGLRDMVTWEDAPGIPAIVSAVFSAYDCPFYDKNSPSEAYSDLGREVRALVAGYAAIGHLPEDK